MDLNKFIFFLVLFCGVKSFSQGTSCDGTIPNTIPATGFCAGTSEFVFPNTNINTSGGITEAEQGPYYGCLDSQPFPAWYFLRIGNDGDLNFTITQTENADGTGEQLDVDFICWGPFSDPVTPCTSELTQENTIDCSYSPSFTESVTINGATTGEYYLLLITNFSQQPGYINLQQTGGTASTDCSILSNLGPDQDLCEGESTILDATTSSVSGGSVTYQWQLFNETTQTFGDIVGETSETLEVSVSGNYGVVVTDTSTGEDDFDDIVITFYEVPTFINQPDLLRVCDDNADGFAVFDLNTQTATILNGQPSNDFQVRYFLTEPDANSGANEVNTTFTNTSNPQTIWARLENTQSTNCYVVASFNLEVVPRPVPSSSSNIPNLSYCDNTTVGTDTDGFIVFDLTNRADEILNGLSPSDYTLQYYTDAAYTNQIADPTAFENTILGGQPIYVRVIRDSDGCYADTSFSIEVYALPEINTPFLFQQCDEDGVSDGITDFNLSEADEYLTQGNNNLTVQYFLSFLDADTNSNPVTPFPFSNSTANTVYARVETLE